MKISFVSKLSEKIFFSLDLYSNNGVSPDFQFSPNLVGRWILNQGLKGRLESRWWALFLELQPKGRLKKWNYRAAQDRQTPFGSVNQKNSSHPPIPPPERKKNRMKDPLHWSHQSIRCGTFEFRIFLRVASHFQPKRRQSFNKIVREEYQPLR